MVEESCDIPLGIAFQDDNTDSQTKSTCSTESNSEEAVQNGVANNSCNPQSETKSKPFIDHITESADGIKKFVMSLSAVRMVHKFHVSYRNKYHNCEWLVYLQGYQQVGIARHPSADEEEEMYFNGCTGDVKENSGAMNASAGRFLMEASQFSSDVDILYSNAKSRKKWLLFAYHYRILSIHKRKWLDSR